MIAALDNLCSCLEEERVGDVRGGKTKKKTEEVRRRFDTVGKEENVLISNTNVNFRLILLF